MLNVILIEAEKRRELLRTSRPFCRPCSEIRLVRVWPKFKAHSSEIGFSYIVNRFHVPSI